MDDDLRQRLLDIWNQRLTPVIVNRGPGFPLRVRLPGNHNAFEWIKSRRNHPIWSVKYEYWKAPRAWLSQLTHEALLDFKQVYLIQTFTSQETCARVCQEAKGFDCDCSCNGAYHGSDNIQGWFEVSEIFATRGSERRMGARLLTKTSLPDKGEALFRAAMLV